MIKFVFKPKRKVRGRLKTSRLYSGRYRLDGEIRMTELALKTSDKQVAEKLLNEKVREKERERAGILPPRKLRESASQPMEKHLADYLNDLRNIGRDDVYVENLVGLHRFLGQLGGDQFLWSIWFWFSWDSKLIGL